jgi:regulator of replication initiation timing
VELERKVAKLKMEVERLKKQLTDSEDRLKTADEARIDLEREISSNVAEINVRLVLCFNTGFYICDVQ